jgi:hypothetical protein
MVRVLEIKFNLIQFDTISRLRVLTSVVDAKQFFRIRILLILQKVLDPVPHPILKYSLFHNANNFKSRFMAFQSISVLF